MTSAVSKAPEAHRYLLLKRFTDPVGKRKRTVRWSTDGTLVYHIAGNGFVYHMVRNLVWSMVQIGLGKKPPQEMAEELKQKRGEFENSPAPAQGLYLAKVEYESYNN